MKHLWHFLPISIISRKSHEGYTLSCIIFNKILGMQKIGNLNNKIKRMHIAWKNKVSTAVYTFIVPRRHTPVISIKSALCIHSQNIAVEFLLQQSC